MDINGFQPKKSLEFAQNVKVHTGIKRKMSNKMIKDVVTLGECTKIIGIAKNNFATNLRKGKYGNVEVKLMRDKTRGNQKVSVISKKDFEKIKKIRLKDGFGINKIIEEEKHVSEGIFYIVQTNPKNIPNRYKCGFSTIPRNRVSSYKIVCPNAKLIFKIKCDDFFEKPLLKMISKDSKRIGTELFEIKDINKITHKIEEVLKLLM